MEGGGLRTEWRTHCHRLMFGGPFISAWPDFIQPAATFIRVSSELASACLDISAYEPVTAHRGVLTPFQSTINQQQFDVQRPD